MCRKLWGCLSMGLHVRLILTSPAALHSDHTPHFRRSHCAIRLAKSLTGRFQPRTNVLCVLRTEYTYSTAINGRQHDRSLLQTPFSSAGKLEHGARHSRRRLVRAKNWGPVWRHQAAAARARSCQPLEAPPDSSEPLAKRSVILKLASTNCHGSKAASRETPP